MKDRLIRKNGTLAKQNDTVSCKYRGFNVECPCGDAKAGVCKSCGWNPAVEMKRIEKAKKQPMKRRPRKSQIFTKGWE